MINPAVTIGSQYGQSPTLTGVIGAFNGYVDPRALLDDFYNNVWNVDTATGWGLDVWGRIVGLPNGRFLQVPSGVYMGLSGPDGGSGDSFNTQPFYSGRAALTSNYALTDDAFRTVIYAKALANVCDGSIPGINQILRALFGAEGAAYVTDGRDMTMTYTFKFLLSAVDTAIVYQSGVLPRPSGVSVSIVQAP